jgi:hypothetical protein
MMFNVIRRAPYRVELTDKDWQAVLWARCESSLLNIAENNPKDIPVFLKALKRHLREFKEQQKNSVFI